MAIDFNYGNKNQARLTVSLGSKDNRKQFSKVITYKTKKDAKDQYDDFKNEIKGGVESSMSVEQLLEWYIESYMISTGKETTKRFYDVCKKPLISFFKGMKANQVTTYHVDRFITAEVKKHAPKTIKNEVSLLSAAYKKAMVDGLVKKNPCEGATLPKQKRKRQITILTDETYPIFVEKLREHPNLDCRVAIELALFCGLRCSEILGITEEDVNLNFKTVSINKARHTVKGEMIIQDTKTLSSYRTVAMPTFLADDIRTLIEEHAMQPFNGAYLIQNQFGKSVTWNFLQKHLEAFLEKHDLPHVTMHGLRHTHASLLISNRMDIAGVSSQLGHSSINTTLGMYTHLFEDANSSSRRIADIFDADVAKDESCYKSATSE